MNKPIIISYYTGDEYYSQHAVRLKAQCKSFGYECHIIKKRYGNNWLRNCQRKPEFILEMLKRLNKPVLFIDVDCEIVRPFDIDIQKDWAVILRSNECQPESFVHYVKPTEQNFAFIDEWIRSIKDNNLGDHFGLIRIFHLLDADIIPRGYFDLGLSPFDDNIKLAHLK